MKFIQKQKVVSIAILATIFILVVLFSKSGIGTTINLHEYYHHTFPYFLWVMGVDLLWVLLLWFIVQKFAELKTIVFLRWLGKNITAFYIIQWLIIGNIAIAIYQTQELSVFGYWFGSILLATIGTTLFFEKMKARFSDRIN